MKKRERKGVVLRSHKDVTYPGASLATDQLQPSYRKLGVGLSLNLEPDMSLEGFVPESAAELDPGIYEAVMILRRGGVETFESCEGGEGHCFPQPTIRFHGDAWAGYHAFSVAMQHGLPVSELRIVYDVIEGQLVGPGWEMTFRTPLTRS